MHFFLRGFLPSKLLVQYPQYGEDKENDEGHQDCWGNDHQQWQVYDAVRDIRLLQMVVKQKK